MKYTARITIISALFMIGLCGIRYGFLMLNIEVGLLTLFVNNIIITTGIYILLEKYDFL